MESWSGIEIRHLTALQAVDRERSFSGAAKRLGYVQSAISHQISQLERLVGVRLVERSRGQGEALLTPAGARLLAHADRVLTQLEAARIELGSEADAHTGQIRVGVFESVAAQVLPSVISSLAARNPAVELLMVDIPADARVFEAIADFSLDAAFADAAPEREPIVGKRLVSDPCVLVVPSDSPLALADRLPTLPEIASMPLIGHPAWRMTALIDAHFEAAGIRPRYRYRADNNVAIQAMVSAGLGVAIMARLAVNEHDPRIAAIPLDALPRRGIGLYWHRERGELPALSAFVDAVETACSARVDCDVSLQEPIALSDVPA